MSSLLSMRDVRKSFGAVAALCGVDLEVRAGEVHALIGENGAGKSTLMKVLSGAVVPDGGELSLDGSPYRPRGPRDALRRGVAMIYQELNLAPELSVTQNIVLGMEPQRMGMVEEKDAHAIARSALARLGHQELDTRSRVAELGPGARQVVEIARALAAHARIVVMDEPTSSLPSADAERLFDAIARLRDDGIAVIYISHFLEEVTRIANRFTVLRDGRSVATGDIAETSQQALIEHMVGRPLSEVFPRVPHEAGEPIVELVNVSSSPLPQQVTLTLKRGEILGIAGLLGAGRSELLRTVFGLQPLTGGEITVANSQTGGARPWARLAQGIGLLSEDRKDEGLSLAMTVTENLTLSHLPRSARFGFLDRGKQRERSMHWLKELSIRTGDPDLPVGHLSGGNQQKVALARLLDLDVDVLLLDEPTRGIDVGSKADIYRLMGELAARGKALVFVSSYIPELLGVCDRIAVMHRGKLVEIKAASDWTQHSLLSSATGGSA